METPLRLSAFAVKNVGLNLKDKLCAFTKKSRPVTPSDQTTYGLD